jgi:hypothetical protein
MTQNLYSCFFSYSSSGLDQIPRNIRTVSQQVLKEESDDL